MANDPFLKQIKIAFARKKRDNHRYSWRQLAAKIGVSHVFLAQIMRGARNFPLDKIDRLIVALELDGQAERKLLASIVKSRLAEMAASSGALARFLKNEGKVQALQTNNQAAFDEFASEGSPYPLFHPWYHAAILDLVETADFKSDPVWIASRLAIAPYQAADAWALAVKNGLVKESKSGQWSKVEKKIRNCARGSTAMMRSFYGEMLLRTNAIMKNRFSQEDFDRRQVMGVTCSANTSSLPAIKAKMEDQLFATAVELADGNCDEVYCLMSIAIPLTKRLK